MPAGTGEPAAKTYGSVTCTGVAPGALKVTARECIPGVVAVTPSRIEPPVVVTGCGTPVPVTVRPDATAVAVTEVASVVDTVKRRSSGSPLRVTSCGYDASGDAVTVRTGACLASAGCGARTVAATTSVATRVFT